MKIRIKPDRWNHLKPVSGRLLTVETDFLFGDQFNTAPVPGISESGFRVMIADVSEIIGDIRPDYMRCNWCGKCSLKRDVCLNCGKSEYLEYFGGRYFPRPSLHRDSVPEEYRMIAGSKSYNRGGILLRNRGMGCAGDSWDNPTHIFSVVYGPKRRDGDYSGYTSLKSFFEDERVGSTVKVEARKMIEVWSKEMGY